MTKDDPETPRGPLSGGSIEALLSCPPARDGRVVFGIGELAQEFGVTLRTLRFYEKRGLLAPARKGTTRLYGRRDRARLRLALLARTLGFSITEAKQLIDLFDQPDGHRLQLVTALARFEEQEVVLKTERDEIDAALGAMARLVAIMRGRLADRDRLATGSSS